MAWQRLRGSMFGGFRAGLSEICKLAGIQTISAQAGVFQGFVGDDGFGFRMRAGRNTGDRALAAIKIPNLKWQR
jgi:hypothetical protein